MANIRGIVIAKICKAEDGEWEYFGECIVLPVDREYGDDDEELFKRMAELRWGFYDWEGIEVFGQFNTTIFNHRLIDTN